MSARRRLLAALALAPLLARAKSAVRRRVALVGFASMFEGPNGLEAVAQALAKRGFADGKQIEIVRVVIEPQARRDNERPQGLDYLVPKLREQVLPVQPDVIVSVGSIMAGGLARATTTIPVVTSVADPVEIGVAASIAKPGGNVTGLSNGLAETSVKTLEFMKTLVPSLARVAIFHDSRTMATRFAGAYGRAARSVGIEPLMFPGLESQDLVRALRGLPANRIQAGMLAFAPPDGGESFFREAVLLKLPLVGTHEGDAESGALVSYQAWDPEPFASRLAVVVEEVLRGADPATTPFRYPHSFRLVVNKRTASVLGFRISPELLLRADRVIE